jgi:hypothetical protein
MAAKWLELLKETVPSVTRVAILRVGEAQALGVLCGSVFSPLTCVCRGRLIENVRDAKKTIVIATA